MAKKSIAVVIPLYNGAQHIASALASVAAQTRRPDEVIVVDDGSTDDGVSIVNILRAKNAKVFSRRVNLGQSGARNFGVAKVQTDLIAFLDQDDIWYPPHLERLVDPFEQESVDRLGWTYSNMDQIDEMGRIVHRSFLSHWPAEHPKISITECLRTDMFVIPSGTVVSRQAFWEIDGFDHHLSGCEDDDLFLRLLKAGYTNIYLPDPTFGWRHHAASATYSDAARRSRMQFFRKLLLEFGGDTYYRKHLILPRFLGRTLHDYRLAIDSGNSTRIANAYRDLESVALCIKGLDGVIIQLLVKSIESPTIARLALYWMHRLRTSRH